MMHDLGSGTLVDLAVSAYRTSRPFARPSPRAPIS